MGADIPSDIPGHVSVRDSVSIIFIFPNGSVGKRSYTLIEPHKHKSAGKRDRQKIVIIRSRNDGCTREYRGSVYAGPCNKVKSWSVSFLPVDWTSF